MAGIERYEVANYATPGFESRHNTSYWTGKSYVGIGPAAHGMLDIATAASIGFLYNRESERPGDAVRVRFANPSGLDEWLMGVPPELELLGEESALREDAMLGMRLRAGITLDLARAAGVEPALQLLAEQGLVQLAGTRWRTTQRGWLLGNEVFGRLWDADSPA